MICTKDAAPPRPAGIVVEKGHYRSPSLIRYGAVRDLTQAGSGTSFETGKPGNCSQTPTKMPCR